MKEKFLILSFILLTLTFDSCFDDEIETLPPCISVDQTYKNDYFLTSKIYETKEIEFEIINDCDSNYTILDYEISADTKSVRIEGLTKNKIISSKNYSFKVIAYPTSVGNKIIRFSIRTNISEMFVSTSYYVDY